MFTFIDSVHVNIKFSLQIYNEKQLIYVFKNTFKKNKKEVWLIRLQKNFDNTMIYFIIYLLLWLYYFIEFKNEYLNKIFTLFIAF